MQLLGEFLSKTRKASPQELDAICVAPALIFDAFMESGDTSFQTLAPAKGGPQGAARVAFVVKKPEANAFATMITLGRAPNNDLVVNVDSVSKFHGYFVQAGDTTSWVDANSANGSKINGELVPTKEQVPLESGARLEFGQLSATFYTQEGLRQFVGTA